MKNKLGRHLLSFLVVALFLVFAVGSAGPNKLVCFSFGTPEKEEEDGKGNYLVKNDGTIIRGNKISWLTGLVVKDQIRIDDQKFKIADIKAYRQGTAYYARAGQSYMQRIVHGKLNVYSYSYTTMREGGKTYVNCRYYLQKGEDGNSQLLASVGDIKKAVADCPAATAMINTDLRKELKKDKSFLTHVFQTYNRNCGM